MAIGRMTLGDDSVYEGNWVDNKKSGKGKMTNILGTEEGIWKDDEFVG